MTDAGTSAEWAEFFDILAGYPHLASRALILPGNHDVNIVDRANPARLDLPFSPVKALRRMRALSAIAGVQGGTLCGAASARDVPLSRLADVLAQHEPDIKSFADRGGFRLAARLMHLWSGTFPLILPPEGEDGLGVALLDSNADTNFSFTNALGLIGAGQAQRLTTALDAHPNARWIVALHHHLAEYPMPVDAFSERVGTALVNGSWFLRILEALRGAHRGYAWPSPHRLDRLLRAPQDHLGPVAGDGASRRADALLRPFASRRAKRLHTPA